MRSCAPPLSRGREARHRRLRPPALRADSPLSPGPDATGPSGLSRDGAGPRLPGTASCAPPVTRTTDDISCTRSGANDKEAA
ncbi:hypothetical protein [Streptomyces nitrosporeus]|uniref:hypothetical protein n=1 Tax=Streptomyces nitrosporeus TaxID=28894 RepID=UPI00399F7509